MGGKTVDDVVYACSQGACGGVACSGAFDDGTLVDNACRVVYNRKNSHKNANHGDKDNTDRVAEGCSPIFRSYEEPRIRLRIQHDPRNKRLGVGRTHCQTL
jgi:hypothetical protein